MCINFFFFFFSSETIRFFSETDDLENLPKTRELECYFNCLFVRTNISTAGSLKLDTIQLLNEMNTLPEYTHNILMKMFKNCLKMSYATNDPCERSYLFHVCLKQTDIEVCI